MFEKANQWIGERSDGSERTAFGKLWRGAVIGAGVAGATAATGGAAGAAIGAAAATGALSGGFAGLSNQSNLVDTNDTKAAVQNILTGGNLVGGNTVGRTPIESSRSWISTNDRLNLGFRNRFLNESSKVDFNDESMLRNAAAKITTMAGAVGSGFSMAGALVAGLIVLVAGYFAFKD